MLPNEGMKQTKPEHNEASQLIPGVRRANGCKTEQVCREERPSLEPGVSRRLPWQQGLHRRVGAISASS